MLLVNQRTVGESLFLSVSPAHPLPTATQTLEKRIDSCTRAYSTVQQKNDTQKNAYGLVYARLFNCAAASLPWRLLELILSLARTSCRLLFTARSTARPLALMGVSCLQDPLFASRWFRCVISPIALRFPQRKDLCVYHKVTVCFACGKREFSKISH